MLADSIVTAPGLMLIALVSSGIIYPMVGLSHGGSGFANFFFALFMSLFVTYVSYSFVSMVAVMISQHTTLFDSGQMIYITVI